MILLIDNYDSFTWNLVQLIQSFGKKVEVIENDKINPTDLERIQPDKIIISPGPGTPATAGQSCNIIREWWERIPIFGVCLGHQCIGVVFQSHVRQSKQIIHGKTSLIHHNNSELYFNIPSPFPAARYHSLSLDSVPENFNKTAWSVDGEIMGISHKSMPVVGVQFHPESFLTPAGKQIMKNFLNDRF